MMDIIQRLVILCPIIFLAGFIDSIAGGGGLISLPAYYLAGLNPHIATASNKFSSSFGTTMSVFNFAKNKHIDFKVSVISIIFSFIGSAFGAHMAAIVNEIYLKYALLIVIPIVAIVVIFAKNFGEKKVEKNWSKKKLVIISAITGLVMGAYDGFIGPGTGTFLILIFTSVFGFDMISASGTSKAVNLSSNYAALLVGFLHGNILFIYAVPAAICSIFGNWVGSSMAIKNGNKIIRPIFVIVIVFLFFSILWEIIKSYNIVK